ncbi:MAG: hypothetical protein IPL91_12725 [Hyphomicrobium sp.]|nr:hypothetical protein [Hyphomicrobium sp.]
MAVNRSIIRGVGAHLPKRIVTNDELAKTLDTSDEWIRERSGILQRHIADDSELTSDLGAVIGAETFSRILDWEDRSTCVLFGDGAGAVVLEAQPQNGGLGDRGILSTRIRSDGRYEDLLYVDGGPGSTKTVGHLRMNGREVFRHAVQKISGVIEETLVETGIAADEIDLFIPHQANKRILDGIAKKLNVSPEKIVMTVDRHGNTSAASIPLALNQAFENHRVKEGSLILMEAMGGGFTWGAVLARW